MRRCGERAESQTRGCAQFRRGWQGEKKLRTPLGKATATARSTNTKRCSVTSGRQISVHVAEVVLKSYRAHHHGHSVDAAGRGQASKLLKTKRKKQSTVRLLEARAGTVATKLLRLAPAGVGNQQAAVVAEQQILDLLLGDLVDVCGWKVENQRRDRQARANEASDTLEQERQRMSHQSR